MSNRGRVFRPDLLRQAINWCIYKLFLLNVLGIINAEVDFDCILDWGIQGAEVFHRSVFESAVGWWTLIFFVFCWGWLLLRSLITSNNTKVNKDWNRYWFSYTPVPCLWDWMLLCSCFCKDVNRLQSLFLIQLAWFRLDAIELFFECFHRLGIINAEILVIASNGCKQDGFDTSIHDFTFVLNRQESPHVDAWLCSYNTELVKRWSSEIWFQDRIEVWVIWSEQPLVVYKSCFSEIKQIILVIQINRFFPTLQWMCRELLTFILCFLYLSVPIARMQCLFSWRGNLFNLSLITDDSVCSLYAARFI